MNNSPALLPDAAPPRTDWKGLHGDHFQGARVLVTGGAGFIGSHLAEALCQLGARVVVLDDLNPLSGSTPSNLDGMTGPGGPPQFVHGSILDRAALAECVAGCRYVFHQAALGSVPQSVAMPALYFEVDAGGTLAVLEACRTAGVERVTFAASSSAYGDDPALPKVETMAPAPCSPYAAAKVASEALCRAYASSYRLDTVALRYFNIFGPRQSPNNAYAAVIAAFAKALLAGRRPVIYGDGLQSRDFTFVDNAVHANLLGARSGRPIGGRVVNVACGERVTVNELAAVMAHLLGRDDLSPIHEAERAGDVKHSQADLSRAQSLLGYRPIVDFRAGLEATVAWYRRALG